MDSYYKLRQLFYNKVRHGLLQIAMDLLQIATGITKCDDYNKLRQYSFQLYFVNVCVVLFIYTIF